MSATPFRIALRAMLILTLGVVCSALFLTQASADSTTYLRLAHLSPDAPAVDVYVASVADPATPAVIATTLDAASGSAYTVAGVGNFR